MCSGGGPFQFELLKIEEKEYRCVQCGKQFRGITSRPVCPYCQSDNPRIL